MDTEKVLRLLKVALVCGRGARRSKATQIYSDASSSKIPGATAAVYNIGKIGENTGMAADESRKQNGDDRWSKEWRQKSSFCVTDGSLSSQEFGAGFSNFKKYKGRVVLRGDIVKDDSGSYAVFTEQGSSASQMTAAKVMDIISRLPACARPSSRRSIR